MIIKLEELRRMIKESVAKLREDVVPDKNDEIDLSDPTVIWNNTYDMDDQETSTRVANKRIKLDPDCADEIEAIAKFYPQLKALNIEGLDEVAPKGWEGSIKRMKKDRAQGKNNIDNPWALAYWMRNKGYHPHNKSSKK